MFTIITGDAATVNSSGERSTNRAKATPVSGAYLPIGLDTIRVSGRVTNYSLCDRRDWTHLDRLTGELVQRSSSAYEVLGSRVALQADERFCRRVSFEVSIPNYLWGDNLAPASVEQVKSAIAAIHAESASLVDWIDDWPDLGLRRVDLVRDLHHVADVVGLLDRLGAVPQANGRVRRRYTNPHLGHAESLTIGTARRWAATAYDKQAERLHAAARCRDGGERALLLQQAERARGQVRIEIGVRARPLHERLHGTQVRHLLREDLMAETARHYFDQARLGTAVGGEDKVRRVAREMASDPKMRRCRDRFFGMLMTEALGLDQTASHNVIDEHMALRRKLDITPADLVVPDRPTIRVDWDTASVTEVAA